MSIILPIRHTDGGYTWEELEIRPTEHGLGVFATIDLPPGSVIPIIAYPIKRITTKRGTQHVWIRKGGQILDGHPSIAPYKGIGFKGLAISMMINEPSHKKPNCIFMDDCVLCVKKIKKNDELSVYYGDEYPREDYKYNLRKNKYLFKNGDYIDNDDQLSAKLEKSVDRLRVRRIVNYFIKL
jgi:hypothetical protein